MSEKVVKRKKKKDDKDEGKPTDEETAVAKYLRFNLSTKSCNFMGNKVEYFTGSKAVDFLLDSKWASGAKGNPILFTDRGSVTSYLNVLLQKNFFMRALKVAIKKKEKEAKEGESKKKSKKSEKEKEKEKKESSQEGGEKKEKKEKSKGEESGDKKQKESKRKIKLEATNEQIFLDGNDAYVWIFDPVKPLHYVYGLGLVIGAIAVCLFPLWPPWMRIGTYYLSVAGACLVGSIVALAIVRTIIYGIIWMVTLGKVSWWLFPNLLADVGILESFQPVYSYEYNSPDKKEGDKDKKEGSQESDEDSKENDNDDGQVEDVGSGEQISEDGPSEDGPSEDVGESVATESGQDQEGSNNEDENISQTSDRSESSSSQGTKDFEMVTKEDVHDAASVNA
ncbi:Translocation protein SEC62 [Holothuria leucospilota]|uniref:Translocation protein SEC62 n=1 Tax=Holothuria leucospilota TaxID=206669 RepID=A0A9Q0YIF6_HOLLE|nr:Translocation protein SEC62 [Holothuria leucospilota]